MPIAFNCQTCGRNLRVKDDLAGAQIYCPDCKSILTVPAGDEPVPMQVEEAFAPMARPALEQQDELSARAEVPVPPAVEAEQEALPEPIAPKYPPARKGPNIGAIIGGLALMGGGGIVLLIALATGIWGGLLKLMIILFIAGIVTFIKGLAGGSD